MLPFGHKMMATVLWKRFRPMIFVDSWVRSTKANSDWPRDLVVQNRLQVQIRSVTYRACSRCRWYLSEIIRTFLLTNIFCISFWKCQIRVVLNPKMSNPEIALNEWVFFIKNEYLWSKKIICLQTWSVELMIKVKKKSPKNFTYLGIFGL